MDVTDDLIVDAAELAERRSLRAHDVVHVAAALAAGVALFVTPDEAHGGIGQPASTLVW